jgi:L-seryl-tRNA selenium transferase
VVDEMCRAMTSSPYMPLAECQKVAGDRVAELLNVDAAHVCGGAAVGIALMAAACRTRDSLDDRCLPVVARAQRVENEQFVEQKRKIIASNEQRAAPIRRVFVTLRAHETPWLATGVALAGGTLASVESADEIGPVLRDAGAEAAGAMLTVSARRRYYENGMLAESGLVARVAREVGSLPVCVDAAASLPPVDNLWRLVNDEGAALAAFSGGKVLRGPHSTGLIVGRQSMVELCRRNDYPNMEAVGRVGKLTAADMLGFVKALELYLNDARREREEFFWERAAKRVYTELSRSLSKHAQIRLDRPENDTQRIPFVAIHWRQPPFDNPDASEPHQRIKRTFADAHRRILGEYSVLTELVHRSEMPWLLHPTELRIHPHTLKDEVEVTQVIAAVERILLSKSDEK